MAGGLPLPAGRVSPFRTRGEPPKEKQTMTPTEQTELPIDSVRPHPSNPRKGNVAKIVESIKANGFYGAIVVQKSTMTILAGNHRWQAAKECGMKTIPAMLLDIDDLSAKKILLADNRTSDFAVYDSNELTALLRDVMSDDSLFGTGFDANDLDKLISEVTDEPNSKRKRSLEPFEYCYWLIKAPTTNQGKITEAVEKVLAKYDGVEIVSATN